MLLSTLPGIRQRLVYKLILAILLFSGCITVVITAIQLSLDYHRDIELIETQFGQIEKSFLPALSSALWRYNDELIRAQAEGIFQLRDIEYLSIADTNAVLETLGRRPQGRSITRNFALTYSYNGQLRTLGTLETTASLAGVYARLVDRAVSIFISSAVKTLLTAAFMLILFNRLVIRHLEEIVSYFRTFNLEAPQAPLRLDLPKLKGNKVDELHRIEREINRLIEAIHHSYDRTLQLVDRRTTELRRTNAELRRTNEELDQFAYAASHDLRTPLRAIQNYTDYLGEDLAEAMTPETSLYLERIAAAVERSERLIDDLLQLSRIGRDEVALEEIDLHALLEEVSAAIAPEENAAIVLPPRCPSIMAHRPYLYQIFLNLLTNGLKYNTSPRKEVRLEFEEYDDRVVCRVSDNGIGIEPQYHDKILEPFSRLHTHEAYPGTGIGLAIVRKALSSLGGALELNSTPGRGSTFTLTFPRRKTTAAPSPE